MDFSPVLDLCPVPSNTDIVRWINGFVYNEMGEVWLLLKLFKVLNIWGVDSKVNLNTHHMDTDRCSLEAPRGRSSLPVWNWALPAPPRDIFLSRIYKSIVCFPRSTQSLWSWGWLIGMTQARSFLWHFTVHFSKQRWSRLCTGPWNTVWMCTAKNGQTDGYWAVTMWLVQTEQCYKHKTHTGRWSHST